MDEAMIENKLKVAAPKEGYFKIFDIQDMYAYDRGGYKNQCKKCRKNLFC